MAHRKGIKLTLTGHRDQEVKSMQKLRRKRDKPKV